MNPKGFHQMDWRLYSSGDKENVEWGDGSWKKFGALENFGGLTMNEKQPIVEKCIGCENIAEEDKCRIWAAPAAKWRLGTCPSATHVKVDGRPVQEQKVRVGQQKQKKKGK